MAAKRYIKQNTEGGWDVLKAGHRRTTVTAATRDRALARARDLTSREGGGEICVVNRFGKVTEAHAVPARASRAA